MGIQKNWAPIAVGEGDVELARELHEKIKQVRSGVALWLTEPPVAQAVYVCGWCVRIVERQDLNWEDDRGVCVCARCAEDFFTEQP